ncbi:MAG: hypothetical protein AAF329_05695 [Cyanobacteria bacterium P01_A01_bin.17]
MYQHLHHKLQQAALLALSLPLTLATGVGVALAQSPEPVLTAQQRPPATYEGIYPYRPACRQLTARPGATAGWLAWGPTVSGEHQNWWGIEANAPTDEVYRRLAEVGLCVIGGEVVPLDIAELSSALSPAQETAQRLKAAPDNPSGDDTGFGQFLILGVLAVGGVMLFERFEDKQWMKAVTGETSPTFTFSPAGIPTSAPSAAIPAGMPVIEPEQPMPAPVPRTARVVLLASPFTSRAFFGGQRTGKTNLAASVLQKLVGQGVNVFVLNLNSYGTEDETYWQGVKSVRGDLSAISDPDRAQALIDDAIALLDEFWTTPNSIFLADEWAYMTGTYGAHVKALAPLIKSLAEKITCVSSSGMKRRQAIWTIAPEIVAGTMEDFGKAVKKLSVCLVAIAPGHTEQWEGQELTFDWAVYSQVAKNYGGIDEPPADSEESRVAFLNGQWMPLGTRALMTASVASKGHSSPTSTRLPEPVKELPEDLKIFRLWLDEKVDEAIDEKAFKNARIFRGKVERSTEKFLILCDKAVMKGWLSQKPNNTYFVLE